MTHQKNLLEKAIMTAVEAHTGQKDKAGREYILHPLRVMMKMKTSDQMITAILHDVVEDSKLTFDDLENKGFAKNIIAALDCLTRNPDKETYEQNIERIKKNTLAVTVKRADLEDNMNVTRLKNMTQEDLDRLKKYNATWHKLSG